MHVCLRIKTWGRQTDKPQNPSFLKYLGGKCLPAPRRVLSTRGELSSWPPDEDWGKLVHHSSASTRLLGRPYSVACQLYLPTTAVHLYRWRASLWRSAVTALWCDVFAPGKQTCLCEGLLRNEEACVCVSLHFLSPSLVLPFSLSCLDSCSLFHANILETLLVPASMHVLLCFWSCFTHVLPLEHKEKKLVKHHW